MKKGVILIVLFALIIAPFFSKVQAKAYVGCYQHYWTEAHVFYNGNDYYCYYSGNTCTPCIVVTG